MDCTHAALVCASFCVSVVSEFAFGTVGFGPAIIYQISWQLLALAGISQGGLAEAVGNILMIEVPCGIMQLFLHRRHFLWRLAVLFCLPYTLMLPLGTLMLERFGRAVWMKRSLGALLLVVAAGNILQRIRTGRQARECSSRPGLEMEPRSWSTIGAISLASAASGLLRGLYGVAGPPFMVLLMFFPVDQSKYRATSATFRLVTPLVQGGLLVAHNDIRPACWKMYLALATGGIVGVTLGNLALAHIDKELFQRSILLFLCSGALLMLCAGAQVASLVAAALVGVAFLAVFLIPVVAAAVRQKRRRGSSASLEVGIAQEAGEEMRTVSTSDRGAS